MSEKEKKRLEEIKGRLAEGLGDPGILDLEDVPWLLTQFAEKNREIERLKEGG